MRKLSKVSAVLLALILALGLFAATAFATSQQESETILPSYHVYYAGNGSTAGSQADSAVYYHWQKATVKDHGTLVKTGHTFDGWNTAADGTGDSYAPGSELDFITGGFPIPLWPYWVNLYGDKTLYAQWEINQYTMTFDSEGGSAVAPVTQNYNTQVAQPADPTKTGHTFAGWYTGDNGTGSAVAFPYTLTGDVTVYAKWDINQFTMTFDSEGGSAVAPVTQNYNTQVAQPADPTKAGHTFAGWYTGDNGTGSAVAFPYTLTGDVTVYAKWDINQYTMTFDSEGGSAVAPVTQNYNTQVAQPANPTKTGHTFAGWYTGDNGTGSAVAFPYTLTGNITVYAKWDINQYTMTFDSEGGNAVAPVTQNYNTQVAQPANPTKTGHTFAGWYTGDGGTGSAVAFPYTLTGNITVYAKWNINFYTMMFDSEGGTNVSPITQAYNTQIVKPADPTRYGFTFAGWYTGFLGTGSSISFPYTIKNHITVHAKWLANAYTLTFDSEGGSAVAPQTRYFGEYVNSPANPTKDGYTFDGWYLGDNGTGSKAVFPYNIVGNATVYAKWTKVAVVSDVSTPTVSSTPTTTISSTPTPTSVPHMGEETNAPVAAAIILSILLVSGVAVLGVKKIRAVK